MELTIELATIQHSDGAGASLRNATPRQGQWRLAAANATDRSSALGGRSAGSRERIMRSGMVVLYRARPALACIIGARRALTVEMISSEEIPCR